jgi:hypothetical protein
MKARTIFSMALAAGVALFAALGVAVATPAGLYHWDGATSTLVSSSDTLEMASSGSGNAYVQLADDNLYEFSGSSLSLVSNLPSGLESLVGAGNGTGYMVDGAGGTLFRLDGTTQNSIDTWGLGRMSIVGAGNGKGYMTVKNGTGTAASLWYLNGGTGGGGQATTGGNLPAGEFLDHFVGAGNGIGYMAETLSGRVARLNGIASPATIDTWGPNRITRLVGAGGITGTAYYMADDVNLFYLNGGTGGGGQNIVFNVPTMNNLVGAGSDNGYYDKDVDHKMFSLAGSTQAAYDTWGVGGVTSLVGGIESGGFAYMVRNNGQIWQIGGTTSAGEVLVGTFASAEIGEVIGLSDGTALYTVIPEPTTLALAIGVAACLGLFRRPKQS